MSEGSQICVSEGFLIVLISGRFEKHREGSG